MQWFSEATDTPVSTAAYAAKVLQQFGGFPSGGQGGGTNERHVTARELINLALAVFCNPIADAQAIITELRAMVPAQRGMPLMCEADEKDSLQAQYRKTAYRFFRAPRLARHSTLM